MSPAHRLPASGSVLGVDVGFSPKRRSSAVCRLDWTPDWYCWALERFRYAEPEAADVLLRHADRPLLAAAFDGPLRRDFDEIGHYRLAERLLTIGFAPLVGKPGVANAPVGRKLNAAANRYAATVAGSGQVAPARHPEAIHTCAIVEAFPTTYLGCLIEAPVALGARRATRSDLFYAHLAGSGGLDAVAAQLLPGRRGAMPFAAVGNHDDRAALACALTALGVAADDYAAVGDDDGWIVLPPPALIRPWAHALLEANAASGGLRRYGTTGTAAGPDDSPKTRSGPEGKPPGRFIT